MPPVCSIRRPGRVIVIGATNTDLVVHVPRLPQSGESTLGGDLLTFAGGKGANQAVAAARAGAKAHFIGAFGNDAFGRARRADLEKEGVDCSGCVVKKGVPSGVALIGIGEGKGKAKAENLIVVAPGANIRLTPEDVEDGLPELRDGDVLLCSLEVPLVAVGEAFSLVASAAARVILILNPAPYPQEGLPDKLLLDSTIITPNEAEFAMLVGAPPRSRAGRSRLLRLMAQDNFDARVGQHFIITRGAKGVVWHLVSDAGDSSGARPAARYARCFRKYGVTTKTIPAPKVKAVDTVGAGDCFNGCLAARLTEDPHDIEGAIRFAVAAAALKVTRHGAQAGLPRRAEILKQVSGMKSETRGR